MSKDELLNEYKIGIISLRKSAKDVNISEQQLNDLFNKCFGILKQNHNHDQPLCKELPEKLVSKSSLCILKKFIISLKMFLYIVIFTIIAYVMLQNHQTTSSIVLRNVQSLIYPGFKILRFISVPIVKRFPSLTELYDESCLVLNPYFYVDDMECWPCSDVHSIIDLTGHINHSLCESGTPSIMKTAQKPITVNDIRQMYYNNAIVFNNDAFRLHSNRKDMTDIKHFYSTIIDSPNDDEDLHILWRINRMAPGRILRSLFPRPHAISKWNGQSVERFLIIDGPKAAPYALPDPECNSIIVTQASGERTIVLKPTRECNKECKPVSIVLKASYVLWYNWWYWKPISLPVENSTDFSITYITPYC